MANRRAVGIAAIRLATEPADVWEIVPLTTLEVESIRELQLQQNF